MDTETVTKPENSLSIDKPYKTKEFDQYVLWKTIPYYFKKPPRFKNGDEQTSAQFLDSMGVDDELMIELAALKTQADFANKYNLSPATLTEWNKLIEARDMLADIKAWALRLSKNIVMAMYNNGLSQRNLNADRDRMNFLKFAGWVEKSTVEVEAGETLAGFLLKSVNKKKDGTTSNTENP